MKNSERRFSSYFHFSLLPPSHFFPQHEKVKLVLQDIKGLVGNFIDEEALNDALKNAKKFFEMVEKDEQLRSVFSQINNIQRDLLRDPKSWEEAKKKIETLEPEITALSEKYKNSEPFSKLSQDVNQLIEKVRENEDLQKLSQAFGVTNVPLFPLSNIL